jgi:hypothetical protein
MIEANLRSCNNRSGLSSAKRQTTPRGFGDLATGPGETYFHLAPLAGRKYSRHERRDAMTFATIALFLANAACVYIARMMAREQSKSPAPWMWAAAFFGPIPLVALAFSSEKRT